MLCCLYFVCCILQDIVKRRFFFITLLTLDVVFCRIRCSIDESPCACITVFFYTLNIVFCPICSIVESPYITFITYFVCCISRVLAWSFGKYICITLFIMSYVTGRVHWNNTYVLQSLFTLNDIFYQTFSIKVSPSIRLSLRLQCLLCFKKHGKKESMSDNLFTI